MSFLKSFPALAFACAFLMHFSATAQYTDTALAVAAINDSIINFDSISQNEVVVYVEPAIADTTLQKLRHDGAFWYAQGVPKVKKAAPKNDIGFTPAFLSAGWFHTLLWVLITASFCAVIILFLRESNIVLFRKKEILLNAGAGVAESIFEIDYAADIAKAAAAGDYRAAIRLHYLQALHALVNEGQLVFKEDYTNSQYLAQLAQSPRYGAFKKLTRFFEFAWYGKMDVSPRAYQNIAADFEAFKTGMGF